MGLLIKAEPQVLAAAGVTAENLANLNLHGFVGNLVSTTTGNIFGGGFVVAAVYWFIYLRPQRKDVKEGSVARQIINLFVGPTAPQSPGKRD
jgi:formate transporter